MSKGNARQFLQNECRESVETKSKPWNYSDQNIPQSPYRTCSSPIDDLEATQNQQDEDGTPTHSVEVQTDRSTLFLLKQNKKTDDSGRKLNVHLSSNDEVTNKQTNAHEADPKLYQVNEFEYVRLKKTGFNYEYDKLEAKLTTNMNTPETFDESDVDQPMDFALCYSETDTEETHKTSLRLPKSSDHVAHGDKVETGKSKVPLSKETTKNKKEMFSNPSKSFKEIFNFFKDRDKKKSNENTKTSAPEASKKVQKVSIVQEQKAEKSQLGLEQCETGVKSRSETSCSQGTPLMFSRCSSLSSLSGIEHISVNDDRSSILSDFSRRTSGVVSPSELPDSPAQFVLSNTRPQQKSHIGFFGKKKMQLSPQPKVCPGPLTDNSHLMPHENNFKKPSVNRYSVFEDDITPFKDESTPTKLHSMAASSLSSLTIDDDDDEDFIHKIILNKEKDSNDEKLESVVNRQEPSGESNDLTDSSPKSEPTNTPYPEQKDINVSEEEEDDELTNLTPYEEQLLDQCIRCGIAKWTKQNLNEINPFSWDVGLSCRATKAIMTSKIRNNSYVDFENNIDKHDHVFINQEFFYDNLRFDRHFEDNNEEEENNETYSDEDLNKNEPSEQEENKLMKNSYYITYEEHLLDQCIRRGIAKITKRNINDIRPFSWDIHQICLTTRAMGFSNLSENICCGH